MKIKSITKLDKTEDVYNMEVKDTHCYLATKSNIILHNCDAMRYAIMELAEKSDIQGAFKNIGHSY